MANRFQFQTFEISDDEFEYFRDLIYREAGINLTPAKRCLVQTRIGKLMRRSGINGYQELFDILENDTSGEQLVRVLDAICTNHTYFFRESEHFEYLEEQILPELIKNKRDRTIRIWSAGCSSGEEPYSLAITLSEFFKSRPNWNTYILATDLSSKVLNTAKNGIYDYEEIRHLSPEIKKRYFMKGKGQFGNLIKVKESLTRNIRFLRHNLLDELESEVNFDIIFCRNVMIYFDLDTKKKVVDRLSEKLKKDGYFISGHSESLNMIEHNFKMIKPTIYRLV